MEMMRQTWQNLAGSAGLGSAAMASPASLDDLERRITDLRAVENWLRMNLSMLNSTIQGMEVQRATIATLKSFLPPAGAPSTGGPSPLEVVLGIHHPEHGGSAAKGAQAAKAAADAAPAYAADSGGQTQGQAAEPPHDAGAPDPTAAFAATATAAAQGWFDMLQKQFDTLAAASTATLQGAEALQEAAKQQAEVGAASLSTLGKAVIPGVAAKPKPAARKAAAKKASKTPAKSAPTSAKSAGKTSSKSASKSTARKK
jgi:hypothetical protein